jgi:hypothetical protein
VGVALDPSGNVFVAYPGNHRIQKFTNSGAFLLTLGWGVQDGMAAFETCTSGCQAGIAGSGDGQFSGLGGVAVDATATSSSLTAAASRSSTTQGTLSRSGRSPLSPGALAVDASGNVFASYAVSLDGIAEYTNTGAFVRTWGCTGTVDGTFDGIGGIAVDGNEHVFVADLLNNRIQKFGCP